MADQKVVSIQQVLPPTFFTRDVLGCEDVLDTELEIVDWYFNEGQFGEYVVIDALAGESRKAVKVSTGAKPILRQLSNLPKDGTIYKATIVKSGRSYMLT